VPEYIEFRDMLPKSKVGKYLRRELRMEERKRENV
jgi:long-chain acyl-CoA synthetase